MASQGSEDTQAKPERPPANGGRSGTRAPANRTPAQERARYLRQLYLLLALIAVLLIVISALVPDRRESRSDALFERPPENALTHEEAPPRPHDHQSDLPDVDAEGETAPADGAERPPSPADGAERPPSPADDPEFDRIPDPSIPDPEAAAPIPEAEPGVVYFVLDDVGYTISELERFLEIGVPMTVSVLPHLPYSTEAARVAAEAGHDVILHMPMEPQNDADPGPGAIMVRHSREEVRRRLESALASVPDAIGANNHMGSAATADTQIVREVLSTLSSEGLFFLDSYTSVKSTVAEVAAELSLPAMQRTIFVDHDTDREAMREALEQGIEHAARYGAAVLIGHVQTPTLPPLLVEAAEKAERRGVRFEGLGHYRDTRFPPDNPISRAMNEEARR